jgi:DNA processing protein
MDIPSIGQSLAQKIVDFDIKNDIEYELKHCTRQGIKVCSYLDDDYPARLKHLDDAPVLLFYKGSIEHLHAARTMAIVGTRKPSEHGKNALSKIVEDLKAYDVTIISGLAYGIDTHAHRESLKNNIPTYGILGTGFNTIYPSANKGLAQKMITDGGLVTELFYDKGPDREHFPMRNRIIAGLSDAVLVAESRRTGGSMITADLANAYHKDVFALPGRINDETSEGPNLLIKSHRANLLDSAKDLAYVMGWEKSENTSQQKELFVELSPEERIIIDTLRGNPDLNVDQLAIKTEMNISKIASLTLNLEFKGMIRSLPGKRFTLI